MKTTLLSTLTLALLSTATMAQNVNIPDANFKAYLVGNTAINTNSDTEIQVSEAATFAGQMDCGYLNIADLTGIEAFTALTELRCYGNNITTLDVSQNAALEYLHCGYNANLGTLYTGSITSLAELNTTDNTSLYMLDVSQNTALVSMDLSENDLSNLDVSQNTALENLNINFNNISSLDLSNNTALLTLSCFNNSLSTLDLSACTNLNYLSCTGNNLTSLDVSFCPMLEYLVCDNNYLTALDVSNNPLLSVLRCGSNTIGQLNVSQCSLLEYFLCESNDLTSLNMKNLSTGTLSDFDATSNPNLTCIEVDDVADATANWTDIDATASFSLSCSSAGISESVMSPSTVVYPNPASSDISIMGLAKEEAFRILNSQGEVILSGRTSNSIAINNLTSDSYFVKLESGSVLLFIKE